MAYDGFVNIAVLGDLHGHLTLAYRLLRRWEREHRQSIGLILQVGDLGAFPPPLRLDDATLRFAKKDPDELGFLDYYTGSPEVDAILGSNASEQHRIHANLYFIKGNHDDFEFLNKVGSSGDAVPVDHHGRILYLPGGVVVDIEVGATTIRVGGLGGIGQPGGCGTNPVSEFFTKSELRRLRSNGQGIDVLLTHSAPRNAVCDRTGSPELSDLLVSCRPMFHFCGHYHEEGRQLPCPGSTRSFLLNEVNFHGSSRLNRRCMGILRWGGPEGPQFEFVEDPWLSGYRRDHYRFVDTSIDDHPKELQ
jgi:Icc-related predicted phosphoesterase